MVMDATKRCKQLLEEIGKLQDQLINIEDEDEMEIIEGKIRRNKENMINYNSVS